MSDLFSDDDRYTALLSRLEALEAAVFPKAARQTPERVDHPLTAAWSSWEAYRRGKGWTAKARALNMQTLRKLAWTDGALAQLIVDQSIERGWTGLFPLKTQEKGAQAATQPVKHKTKAQALAPTEDRLTAQIRWLEQSADLRGVTPQQLAVEIEDARRKLA